MDADELVTEYVGVPIDEARRARRRRRVMVATAVLAVVALSVVVVASLGGSSEPHRPSPPARSSAPSGAAPTLDDLPRGAPPQRAYVTGKTLHLPTGEVALEGRPDRLSQAGASVFVQYRDQSLVRVDAASHASEVITDNANGPFVVDQTGKYVAWQLPGGGRARVIVRTLDGSGRTYAQTFPGTPTCCDNPFDIDGITESGLLFGSLADTVWVWDIHTDGIAEVRGLAGGFITQVTAHEIAFRLPDSRTSVAGTVTRGRFEETQRIDGQAVDFADPSGRRIIYTNADGDVHVRDTGPGVTAPNILYRDIALHLAGLSSVPEVYWEDGDHVLLDASEDGIGAGWLVRCDVGTRACETAVRFAGSHLVAR